MNNLHTLNNKNNIRIKEYIFFNFGVGGTLI